MRELIEKRLQEFLADQDPRFEWLKPAVRKYEFLPLYLGWLAVLGIRADGSFVRWDHEDRESVTALSDPYLRRMALCQGAKKYPELVSLIPHRPIEATDCASCKGSGQIEGLPQIICSCGGVGWILPGEEQGPTPG